MSKKFCFSDYIEVLTSDYDYILFNPVYSNNMGLYLQNEEEKPIEYIVLVNSRIFMFYVDGGFKELDVSAVSIKVHDELFKRRFKYGFEGTLLKYDYDAAICYNLDVTKAIDKKNESANIRKRSI